MARKILFITPPFTQLNTPYPATAYLKGYLNTLDEKSVQADLSLETILSLFSASGLRALFDEIQGEDLNFSDNTRRILSLRDNYIGTIDRVISFLQGREQTLAHLICEDGFLPEASRFDQLDDLEWAFGTMGQRDKARYLATLYLEDISDLIKEAIDPLFGFSRYAESLGRSASSFDELHAKLQAPPTYIDRIMLSLLQQKMEQEKPDLVAITIPFPGNLYSALRCGRYLKQHFPHVKVEMGGGFISTELRQLSDERLFEYADFILMDAGERSLDRLLSYLDNRTDEHSLVNTYMLRDGKVLYYNDRAALPVPQIEAGTPDYAGLPLDHYLSVIEIANPMHRLWSDGRWNKLTLAYGCYWGKCAFCDGSLDYIGRYEPNRATVLADRMEELINRTGERGFHFVDEAAPPSLLKELALEILRRKLVVVWWTNVRFEKSFTSDLCYLLRASGCIAVSGGLEVASDRLLKLINKGVTVEQVVQVTDHFTRSGIMVHAYLMYGFPSQTAQETIDSLEIVRQLFENGLIQSGFWHRFALTAHSPVGANPEKYGIRIDENPFKGFARNDLEFTDEQGCDPEPFGDGLRKSLFNYMHGLCFDFSLQRWFEMKIPHTQIPPTLVERYLDRDGMSAEKESGRLLWLHGLPEVVYSEKMKKGKKTEIALFTFHLKNEVLQFNINATWGRWLADRLPQIQLSSDSVSTPATWRADFAAQHFGSFDQFTSTPLWLSMRDNGLLVL